MTPTFLLLVGTGMIAHWVASEVAAIVRQFVSIARAM